MKPKGAGLLALHWLAGRESSISSLHLTPMLMSIPCQHTYSWQDCYPCAGDRQQLNGSSTSGRELVGGGSQQMVQQEQQQPKQAPVDSKVLLSVAAALQGNGLAQVMRQLASRAQGEDDMQN